MSCRERKKLLIVFDFDDTLINGNSEISIIPRLTFRFSWLHMAIAWLTGRWTEFMHGVHQYNYDRGNRGDTLLAVLDDAKLEVVPGMDGLLTALKTNFEAEVLVVSNSNTIFVEHLLTKHGLRDCVDGVVANPAEFEADGRLSMRPYASETCAMCPPSLCKGRFLREYVEGKIYDLVAFAGDGSNDVCPMLECNYAFPRRSKGLCLA
jgi:pyridoxal phosphate phosphatase PHOSPHO2